MLTNILVILVSSWLFFLIHFTQVQASVSVHMAYTAIVNQVFLLFLLSMLPGFQITGLSFCCVFGNSRQFYLLAVMTFFSKIADSNIVH